MLASETTAPAASAAPRQPLTADFPISDVGGFAGNLWRHRELLWHLTIRNLRSQYKQSMLGYVWILANPAIHLLTLTFVFSVVLRAPSQGVPFALFLCVGLVPWLFFASTLVLATDSITGSVSLVTMVYFPREILVVSAVIVRVIDLAASLLVLAALLVYYGYPITSSAAWIPIIFVLHLAFTVGLSLPLAALNLFFHDVRFLVSVGLNLWFFLTPIIYPVDVVPPRYRFLYDLNPNTWFIEAYRAALLHGTGPSAEQLFWGTGAAVLTLATGYYLFKRAEPAFADRI